MITTIDGKTMGGLYRLRVPTAQVFSGLKALTQDVLDRIDTQMSAWISHSDLCRFNVTPVGEWVSIPSDMANVVALGLQMSTFTDGALNICLGQQSRAFGFMPGKVGGSNFSDANTALDLDLENTMLRRRTDVVLDLNAIAKGYAADLVCSTLRQSGVRDMMIEVAGDICAIGQRPDQNPWTVAMELPLSDRIVPIRFVPLKDQA
ncbi:MAG: FAD:protein FMN transferase, partial [Rhodobacteraceae bacterium]|nr:FAD:protein FMN transferase [Paracoccaceae bacterium]